MKHLFLLLFVVLVGAGEARAQRAPAPVNSIYGEFFGSGISLSVNYERLVTGQVALRVGAGYLPVIFADIYSFPLTASYLVGAGRHKLEVGGGVALFQVEFDDAEDDEDFLGSLFEGEDGGGVTGTLIGGYRFQGRRALFRANLTPHFHGKEALLMAGLSVGYRF